MKTKDQQLLEEAYANVANGQAQTKTAKFINTQKAGHLGNLSVYEMNPKLEQTGSEWFGIATGPDGKISLVDPDSEFMDSVEIPALKGVDLTKATPEMILSKLGYKVSDQDGQQHLPVQEATINNMSPEEREAYEAELDKKEKYKQYLSSHNTAPSWTLEQAYEGIKAGKVSFEEFEDWIGNL